MFVFESTWRHARYKTLLRGPECSMGRAGPTYAICMCDMGCWSDSFWFVLVALGAVFGLRLGGLPLPDVPPAVRPSKGDKDDML